MDNQAQVHVDRVERMEAVKGTSTLTLILKDGSRLDVAASQAAPELAAQGPPDSFARRFKDDVVSVQVTIDEIAFTFGDGSRFGLDITGVPRQKVQR